MTPLFKRKPVSRSQVRSQVRDQTNEHPFDQALPAWNPNEGLGKGFNIVKMIEEHTPQRIDDITKQVADYEQKIKKLRLEATQLRRLLSVLNTKISPSV